MFIISTHTRIFFFDCNRLMNGCCCELLMMIHFLLKFSCLKYCVYIVFKLNLQLCSCHIYKGFCGFFSDGHMFLNTLTFRMNFNCIMLYRFNAFIKKSYLEGSEPRRKYLSWYFIAVGTVGRVLRTELCQQLSEFPLLKAASLFLKDSI